MILNIILMNIVDVMVKNDLLVVIFFVILFGVVVLGVGKVFEFVMKFFEFMVKIMFKLM